jgi:hypothetical protein
MLMSENHTTLPFHRVSPGALGVRPGLWSSVSSAWCATFINAGHCSYDNVTVVVLVL